MIGEVEKVEFGDLGKGKIREVLDGLLKSFNFFFYIMGGF